eukprot:m.1110783 g.1110783  ORF g.1110783 m.1110783 type:complete len:479 (-) comp24361_c0_seq2:2373-3809(-)
MKLSTLALVVVCAACSVYGGDVAGEGGIATSDVEFDTLPVMDLDELALDEFRSTIARGKWFIKFYAPWCQHCRALSPIWNKLAAEVHAGRDAVNIARFDCVKQKETCAVLKIAGYPTLRFFDGDFEADYRSARSYESILTHVQRAMQPLVTTLESEQEFEKAVENHPVFFLHLVPAPAAQLERTCDAGDAECSSASGPTAATTRAAEWAAAYAESASSSRFYATLFNTTDPGIHAAVQKAAAPSIASDAVDVVVVKGHEISRYPGKHPQPLLLTKWISRQRFARVEVMSHAFISAMRRDFPELAVVAVVLNVSDAAVAAVDDAREMARLPRFADALQFSYMDFGKWSEFLVNKWDLTADDLPAVVVLRPESQEYAVLATGENAVRHEALGTYGLKTDVIIERLDAVVANNVTWSGRRTALDRLRRSIYTAVEQFIVVFGALQAEHPMLVHGSVASTLMLFVVLLRTCFAGSSGKPKKD